MMLREFLDRYFLEHDLSPSTECQLAVSVSNFEKFVGKSLAISEITTDQINSYLKSMQANGRAYDTIRSRRGNLVVLLNEAYRQNLTSFDSRRIRKLKPDRPDVECWTPEETSRLAETARSMIGRRRMKGGIDEGKFWFAYVNAAWDSGLRMGDLSALKMSVIAEVFWIKQKKTGLPVLVELHGDTLAAIRQLYASGDRRERPFHWPYGRETFFERARLLIERAGLTGTLKYIRRGVATEIATRTQRVGDATRKLGQSSEAVTLKHYLRNGWQKFPPNLPPKL